jgi:ubiquinone/menaquinone biosynthesis C-methylase UbiE
MSDAFLYDRNYFDGYYLHDPKREQAYKDEHARVVKYFLTTHYKPQGELLDIGCGIGGFTMQFDDRWTRHGIEPSTYAAGRAEDRGIILVDFKNLRDECMDLIIFRGTLQHIDYPMHAIAEAVRALKRDGLLVILATPDTDSIVYKIWGRLPALDAPKNWVLFGHRMLNNILIRHGMKATFTYPYLQTPYAKPIKDISKFIASMLFGWRPFAFWGSMMEVYAHKSQ